MMKYLSFLFLLLIVSCNKPKTTEIKKEVPEQDIALVVDLSLSMLSKDFEPNRITAVTETLKKIITFKEDHQAFSIVLFAGNSYIVCPLTKDKKQLLEAVNKINQATLFRMKFGTDFPDAIMNGVFSLKNAKGNKSLLIFSDGSESTVHSFPLRFSLEEAVDNNIQINSIITSPKDSMIAPTSMDVHGNLVFSKLKVPPMDKVFSKESVLKTNGSITTFRTKKELDAFDFKKFISQIKTGAQNQTSKSAKDSVEINKILKKIEKTNDSLALVFSK